MMEVKKYVKKPIPVEAVLLSFENIFKVKEWIESYGIRCKILEENDGEICLMIETLEGDMIAKPEKHYIVKGIKNEFYPVEKSIFEETYEEYKGGE